MEAITADKAEKAAYMRQYRAEHREEIANRRREQKNRLKAEQAEANRAAWENMLQSKLKDDDAFKAALINQKYGFSFICGAHYNVRKTVIIEKVRSFDRYGSYQPYRVKTVSIRHFETLDEALKYCESKNISFPIVSDMPDASNNA